ncbi:MAG: sulfatase [Verrucomicrobiota bacterium]
MKMQPNILVITTHDTGRHFGCYGVNTVHSPAIDGLAALGVKCANYFTAVPICCASRATMMTGRYPQSHGLMDLFFPPFGWEMKPGEQHLSQILRAAGYRTQLFGMQHETGQVDRLGFDKVWHAGWLPAPAVADSVAAFLESQPAEPFYAQVGFYETHSPYGDPDGSRGVFVPPQLVPNQPARDLLAKIQGSVRQADAGVATIIAALARTGLADNTILIFTVDHGMEIPRAKWFLYDAGIEIGLIVRWPNGGVTGGRQCDWLLSNVDFVPTLLDLAAVPIPGNIQGRSFANGLRGVASPPPRQAIFGLYQKSESRCIRTDRYKLIRNFNYVRANWAQVPADISDPARNFPVWPVELYDLVVDPLEANNLAAAPEFTDIRRDLSNQMWDWLEAVDDYILRGSPAANYYQPAIADYRIRQQK